MQIEINKRIFKNGKVVDCIKMMFIYHSFFNPLVTMDKIQYNNYFS